MSDVILEMFVALFLSRVSALLVFRALLVVLVLLQAKPKGRGMRVKVVGNLCRIFGGCGRERGGGGAPRAESRCYNT